MITIDAYLPSSPVLIIVIGLFALTLLIKFVYFLKNLIVP